MSGDALRAFTDALAAAGLHPKSLIADGGLHRCTANGDKAGKQSGWYVLHLDDLPAGVYGDWRTGHSERWQHDKGRPIVVPTWKFPANNAAERSLRLKERLSAA